VIENHVHQIGAGAKCETCDFVLKIPRFCFSIEISDNDVKGDDGFATMIVNEGYNSNDLGAIAEDLRQLADKLDKRAKQ
jgi:hypothetical protein